MSINDNVQDRLTITNSELKAYKKSVDVQKIHFIAFKRKFDKVVKSIQQYSR